MGKSGLAHGQRAVTQERQNGVRGEKGNGGFCVLRAISVISVSLWLQLKMFQRREAPEGLPQLSYAQSQLSPTYHYQRFQWLLLT